MKQKFLNSTIGFLQKYNDYSEKDLMKLKYGLEGLYLTITKLVVILAIALILGIIKEVILVLILFNIIRYFGFGFHAEKSSECLVLSILNFILIPYGFMKLNVTLTLSLIIVIICFFNFLLFAPADTVKRPFKNKRKRIIRKIITCAICIVYSIAMFVLNDNKLSALILSSLVIQVIMVCPLTYWLFKQPYGNYKNN